MNVKSGIPTISGKFFCIIDAAKVELAAVISSHISVPGEYVPFFAFPETTIGKVVGDETISDKHEMSRRQAAIFGVLVSNAFSRIGGTENLILAGLTVEQKSNLKIDFAEVNVIEIDDILTVENYLGAFSGSKIPLRCQVNDVAQSLVVALRDGHWLIIDNMANSITDLHDRSAGLVVIEKGAGIGTVLAVNYASSINADILFVEPLEEGEDEEIKYLLARRQDGFNDGDTLLEQFVKDRVGMVEFKAYSYCTFFTAGIPYSMVLQNVIPFSQVHLHLKMDFFLFNGILYETEAPYSSGVIFSPGFFKDSEETIPISNMLEQQRFFVKRLLNEDASAFNLDMHVKEYPFDVLHICSHGGNVPGEYCSLQLTDEKGENHTIEFDLVVSLYTSKYFSKAPRHTKFFWRRYNGLSWNSPEFWKAGGIDGNLFARFRQLGEEMMNGGELKGSPVTNVHNSECVICYDSAFLGMIDAIAAARVFPFIFNNSCWSGFEMAKAFIDAGARAYIGTLWNVEDKVASEVAEAFYENVFELTISEAILLASNKGHGVRTG